MEKGTAVGLQTVNIFPTAQCTTVVGLFTEKRLLQNKDAEMTPRPLCHSNIKDPGDVCDTKLFFNENRDNNLLQQCRLFTFKSKKGPVLELFSRTLANSIKKV